MRAMQVRENLEGLAALGEEVDASIRAKLGSQRVELIETATRSKWLPLQIDIELSRLVDEAVGRAAFIRWSQAAIMASADSPLLSGFVRAGLRLLGGNPGSLIRLAQRGYPQLLRNAGSLRVDPLRDDAVRVVGIDLPQMMLDQPLYLEGIGASIAVLPHFVRHVGEATLEVEGAAVSWVIEWRAREAE